jgi:hypothetical protein
VSEITTIMRMLDRIAVGRLMRDVGTMGMGRAESALLARPREDHLGLSFVFGAHKNFFWRLLRLALGWRVPGVDKV